MKCLVGTVTTPRADTPGTLFYIHFDDRRYLVGNVSEGTSRALNAADVSVRKVDDIFITGRTRWSNIGGLLGLILGLADSKTAAKDAAKAMARTKSAATRATKTPSVKNADRLDIYGPSNLTHVIATARRFIFRRGLPIDLTEIRPSGAAEPSQSHVEPSFADDKILVWSLPSAPSAASGGLIANAGVPDDHKVEDTKVREDIVGQMFKSDWRYDRLVEQKLAEVKMPATCYLRDPETRQMVLYNGPKPGQDGRQVPDIYVYVREPWPSVAIETLPPTKPSHESMSYIIRNHPQRGKFLPEVAERLGVPKTLWKELTGGGTVQNAAGEDIRADMVLQPGKPGSGLAVIDLPSVDHIDTLLKRPEWDAENVVENLKLILWILGPGVGADPRIANFQERFATEHIVSSPDYTINTIALDGAATNALRHHRIDPEVFPKLESVVAEEDNAAVHTMRADLPRSRSLEVGQQFILEPSFSVDERFVVPPLNIQTMERRLEEEISKHPELVQGSNVLPSDEDVSDWQRLLGPHQDVEIIVLGTGSSMPSKHRNVSGTLVRIPGWGSVLLDCGEGSLNTLQRMFSQQEVDDILADLKMIWISHLHADHHLGLTSFIKAWNRVRIQRSSSTSASASTEELTNSSYWADINKLLRPEQKLAIVSGVKMGNWIHEYASVENLHPRHLLTVGSLPVQQSAASTSASGTSQQQTLLASVSSQQQNRSRKDDRQELQTESILEALNLTSLNSVFVNHCHGAQAVSITFPNGFKLSYSGDCRPCAAFTQIGYDSHVLIHEATFEDDMRMEAIAKKHSTAGEALIVAAEMNAKLCMLTHFSQRYPTMPPLGVDVSGTDPGKRLNLQYVLEQVDARQPEANVPEEDTVDEDRTTRSRSRSRGSGRDNGSSQERNRSRSTIHGQGKREERAQKQGVKFTEAHLIDQSDIQRLIDQTGLKVVFAFDYMRLKLSNVPRLVKRMPVMRRMYELEVGKRLIEPLVAPSDEEMERNGGINGQKKGKKKLEAKEQRTKRIQGQMEAARERKRRRSEEFENFSLDGGKDRKSEHMVVDREPV